MKAQRTILFQALMTISSFSNAADFNDYTQYSSEKMMVGYCSKLQGDRVQTTIPLDGAVLYVSPELEFSLQSTRIFPGIIKPKRAPRVEWNNNDTLRSVEFDLANPDELIHVYKFSFNGSVLGLEYKRQDKNSPHAYEYKVEGNENCKSFVQPSRARK